MGYQVLIEELRKASDATRSAVDQVKVAQLGAAADKIARALPGAMAAPAASDAGWSWTDTVASWCRAGADYAEALRHSADEYQVMDQEAVSDLHAAGGV